jgi:hypothetical protein
MAETDQLCVTSRIHPNLTANSIVGKVVLGSSPITLSAALLSLWSRALYLVSKLKLVRVQ